MSQKRSAPVPDEPPDPSNSPIFQKLIELIEKQSTVLERQAQCLETLEKNVLKEEQPHPATPWHAESGWSAVFEAAVAKTREKTEEWKGFLDVSLVFTAIFLAVVTSFLVPAAQALQPNDESSSSAPPPPPPESAQTIYALYYLALTVSILNAVLCVLGRQWIGKLNSIPVGKTHIERTMRHEERKALAWSWLAPLIWLLFGTLLLAISLFVVGYLYQLQVLSTSFSGPAPILRAAYIIAIILALCVLVLLALTVVHGVLIPNSPFEGPLSKSLLSLIPSRMRRSDRFTILTSNNRDREWEETRAAREEAVSTYARLISETNDPNLLDRAAPSLVFKECMSSASLPHLIAATRRLLSTDTSIRVKATVRTQYDAFIGWLQNDPVIHVQQSNALSVDDVRDIIRWKNECSTLLQIKSERIWFSPVNVILTSFLPHNKDLLPIGRLPFEQCIARVLCIFDQSRQLGDCEDVLRHAMGHCNWLIAHQKVDDVTRILSHVDRNSLLRSLIRNTCLNWPLIRDIVGILIQGREEETLVEMAPFLTGLPDVGRVFGSFIVVDFLEELAQRLGSDLRTPADIDFSRLCSLIIQEYSSTTWTKEASIVMLYREHSETLQVADKAIARDFFRLCLLRSEEDSVGISSLRVPYCLGERAQFYLSCLTEIPSSEEDLPGACAHAGGLTAEPTAFSYLGTIVASSSRDPRVFCNIEALLDRRKPNTNTSSSSREPHRQRRFFWSRDYSGIARRDANLEMHGRDPGYSDSNV